MKDIKPQPLSLFGYCMVWYWYHVYLSLTVGLFMV